MHTSMSPATKVTLAGASAERSNTAPTDRWSQIEARRRRHDVVLLHLGDAGDQQLLDEERVVDVRAGFLGKTRIEGGATPRAVGAGRPEIARLLCLRKDEQAVELRIQRYDAYAVGRKGGACRGFGTMAARIHTRPICLARHSAGLSHCGLAVGIHARCGEETVPGALEGELARRFVGHREPLHVTPGAESRVLVRRGMRTVERVARIHPRREPAR